MFRRLLLGLISAGFMLAAVVSSTARAAETLIGRAEIANPSVPEERFGVELFTAGDLHQVTTMIVRLTPSARKLPDNLELLFDARMPEHNHGMVTKAKVTKKTVTEFLVQGVKLHMRGKWQFNLQFLGPTAKKSGSTSQSLEPSIFDAKATIDYTLP